MQSSTEENEETKYVYDKLHNKNKNKIQKQNKPETNEEPK